LVGRLHDGRDGLAGRLGAVVSEPGEPGKPGEAPVGSQGGRGGEGGRGGHGTPEGEGGKGGHGGSGEDMSRGLQGIQGEQGKGAPRRALVGYVLLAVGVALGLFFTWRNTRQLTNERADRSIQLNQYLALSCARDKDKDAIFVAILDDAIRRTEKSVRSDPATRRAVVENLRHSITEIHLIDSRCVSDIPSPIPHH
jgi:hypothetical protein